MLEKYTWIAERTGYDADDVMDIILGNITKPRDAVHDVLSSAASYDALKEAGRAKTHLDS